MGFSATIMSKDEAMKLPLKDRPLCFRVSSEIYHETFQSIGAASMCWEPIPDGVFCSEKASQIAVELLFKFANEIEKLSEKSNNDNANPT